MQANVTNYIYDKVKELMMHFGLPISVIEQYGTLIISAIVIIFAIAAMEITYRIMFFTIKRIV